jgi:hypothetical protein
MTPTHVKKYRSVFFAFFASAQYLRILFQLQFFWFSGAVAQKGACLGSGLRNEK